MSDVQVQLQLESALIACRTAITDVIRAHLDRKGLSQAAAARLCGITAKHMNQMCQGVVYPSARLAVQLETHTGLPATTLMWLVADARIVEARIEQHKKNST